MMNRTKKMAFWRSLGIVPGLFCLMVSAAWGAELRYIRIGEHKEYTRIVFEFRGKVSFQPPEIRGSGEAAVVFFKAQTALPEKIVSETTKRVDAIFFEKRADDLVARITFPFPYFEVKAFSLSDPERVVLDVNETAAPAKEAIVEEALGKEKTSASVETAPAEGEDVLEPLETAPFQETPPEPGAPLQPAESVPETRVSPLVESLEEKTEDSGEGTGRETAGESATWHEEDAPITAGEPLMEEPQPESTSPAVSAQVGGLHIYLLVLLVVLSVIIAALLLFLILKKKRVAEEKPAAFDDRMFDFDHEEAVGETDDALAEAAPGDSDGRMAAIDAKIRDALKRMDQP